MKHLWLYLLWLYPLAMFGQEATTKATCYLKIRIEEEVTTYYFDQVQDLEAHCEKLLEDIAKPEKKKKKKDKIPEPEVEVGLSYNNQKASETIAADLAILKETIQKLKIQLQIPPKR
jgi:hypothetical protein